MRNELPSGILHRAPRRERPTWRSRLSLFVARFVQFCVLAVVVYVLAALILGAYVGF